ncbi:MAG: thioredoxin domain-containing protein [Nannocystaceae bacterium]|nr:thioredoxin domain-containing protein [Nannocystaceae bacterium]
MKHRSPRIFAIVLAAAGFVVSGVLEYVHAKTYLYPASSSFCSIDATLNCGTIAMSRFSVLLGIPMPVWGAAGFLAIGAAVWRRSKLVLPLCAVATAASVALLLESLLHVGAVCLLCEAVHGLSLILLLVAVLGRKTFDQAPDREALIGIGLFPSSLLVIALLLAPRYWEPLTWQTDVPHATGVTENGQAWVGASEPTVIVEEWVDYNCPHCALASNRMRMRLVHDADALRVVRRHEPRMLCKKIGKGCKPLRAALCAEAQGKFWEMDSWLFLHAPGPQLLELSNGARTVGLDVAKFERCLDATSTWTRAADIARAARKTKIIQTPTYIIDGQRYDAKTVHAYLDDAL